MVRPAGFIGEFFGDVGGASYARVVNKKKRARRCRIFALPRLLLPGGLCCFVLRVGNVTSAFSSSFGAELFRQRDRPHHYRRARRRQQSPPGRSNRGSAKIRHRRARSSCSRTRAIAGAPTSPKNSPMKPAPHHRISSEKRLEQAFDQISEELRSQYQLATISAAKPKTAASAKSKWTWPTRTTKSSPAAASTLQRNNQLLSAACP